MPTPVVNRQPLMPARAMGTPTRKQNASHRSAAGEKSVPPPSVARPCGIGCIVAGLKISGVPVTLLNTNFPRGTRVRGSGSANGAARVVVAKLLRMVQNKNDRRSGAAAIAVENR